MAEGADVIGLVEESRAATGWTESEPAFRLGESCSYVIDAEAPDGPRFCDAAATRGSAYCARHRALCGVDPDTPQGATLARELERAADIAAPPPPDLARLECTPLLEPQDEDDPAEIAGLVDAAPERRDNLD